jgi:Nif-specific regulatory protein
MPRRHTPAVLHSVADLLAKPVATDQLLHAIIDRVVAALDAERGTLYLVDAATDELVSRVAHLPELTEIRLPPGKGIAGHVAVSGEPVITADVTDEARFFPGIDRQTGFKTRNMLTVPVQDAEGRIRGVLQLLNRRGGDFDEEAAALLRDLASEVSQALDQTSLRPPPDTRRGVLLEGPLNNVVGNSPLMRDLYERILAAANTDAAVLLRGETGTGKTLLARAVHDNSRRQRGPLVHVECTALPESLIESALFGHEKGAFTGADRRVPGKCELADGGTLFLDEIGDLPLALQGKLLRFLQSYEFDRLGGTETLRSDVRVVAATNANLEHRLDDGRFRRDLYYRLRVVELRVPSLRERGSADIEQLARHFLDRFTRRHRRRIQGFHPEALGRLARHDWPGNVRELEYCIESAVVLAGPGATRVEPQHLSLPGGAQPPPSHPLAAGYPVGTPLRVVERDHIRRTLEQCAGNRTQAAAKLGIHRNTLARKLADYDL